MSWIYSRAIVESFVNSTFSPGPVEEYSQAKCSDIDVLQPLNVTHTPKPSLWLDKTMEHSPLSRFGMTYGHLTEGHGAELLTWWLGDFLAKTYQSPEKERELRENGLECGPTWRASLAKFDPVSCSWKTVQLSLLGDSTECSVIWPRSGMTAGGQCWELPTLAPPTSATGSGVWVGTPTTGDALGSTGRSERFRTKTPTPLEFVNMWPTPTVCGNYNRKGASKTSGDGLATAVRKWTTPTAHNAKETNAKSEMNRNTPTLAAQAGGSLNPDWTEWLLGWPIGHTDLKRLETAKSRCVLQQHGTC